MYKTVVDVCTGDQQIIEVTPDEIAAHQETYAAYQESQRLKTWDDIRIKRDQLIRNSDWTMVSDATVNQGAWSQYRQMLRDLPQTYAATGPESVVWPEPPSTSGPNTIEG